MSIEGFLLVNLTMDLCLLAVVARAGGFFSAHRVLLGSGLCTLYAVAAALRPSPLASVPAQLLLLALVSSWICGIRDPRLCATTALLLAVGAMLAGGAARMLAPLADGPRSALPAALAGIALLAILLHTRNPGRDSWQLNIALSVNGRTARFPALIDTGNRLREPLSGRPVLIAEAKLLRDVLPVEPCRSVDFGGLGGSGSLRCFQPGALWAERGLRRKPLPIVWVAVVPGSLPGPARALAPCEFAGLSL